MNVTALLEFASPTLVDESNKKTMSFLQTESENNYNIASENYTN